MNSPQPNKYKTLFWITLSIAVMLAAILFGVAIWLAIRFLVPVAGMQPAGKPATDRTTERMVANSDRNAGADGRPVVFDTASFTPHLDIPTASEQVSLAFGDLDRDGKPDVVVVNYSQRTLSVFKNISQRGVIDAASFAPPVPFTIGQSSHAVQLADLDGDGKQDIICLNEAGSELSLFRNTAKAGVIDSSSFTDEAVLITPPDPRAVVARDLNGDGKPDLVVACYGSGTLSVVPNGSTPGTLLFGTRVNLGSAPTGALAVGDIDGDGKADIIVPGARTPVIWIYRNVNRGGALTPGSFAPPVTLPGHSSGVTLADMDGDRKLDLVSVHESQNTVSVWRNISTRGVIDSSSFANPVDFPTGAYPYMPIVARLDGDARPDLVVANASSHTISVYRNLSSPGSFTSASLTPKVDYPTGKGPRLVDIADIDGDGWPDIANANASQPSFSVFRQVR